MATNTNTTNPLVSVITPTYNRPEYLKEALTSAVRQKYKNIEIIVSDNCSPQNIQEIIDSFGDSRIRYSRNETNLGMFPNTIKTFKMAQGKYVACLLDDDMWEEEFLEKLVPILEANPNLALAFSDHYIMDAKSEINLAASNHCSRFYKRAYLKEGIYQPFYKLGLIDKAVPTAMSAVIRRNIIDWDRIPQEVGPSWDIYLTYLCCNSGLGAYYYPERLTRYREHELTATMLSGRRNVKSKISKAEAELYCYEQFMKDEALKELQPYFQQQWAHVSTTLGVGLMRAENINQARYHFWRSLQQKFSFRTIAALLLSLTPPKIAAKF
jgi:glycosyltransferase involved in cell wall biosynthesis